MRVRVRVRVRVKNKKYKNNVNDKNKVYISGVPIHKNERCYARINAFIKLFSTFWIALLSR